MAREVRIGNNKVIRENSEGRLHVIKERSNAWPAKCRAAFLDHLAASCNVTEAAKAVGVFPATPHRVRRRDPAFAQQWLEALKVGYVTLETMLLNRAILAAALPTGETAVPDANGMTTDQALRLLERHKNTVSGVARRAGPKPATEEETYRNIVKKLAVLRKRIDAGRA